MSGKFLVVFPVLFNGIETVDIALLISLGIVGSHIDDLAIGFDILIHRLTVCFELQYEIAQLQLIRFKRAADAEAPGIAGVVRHIAQDGYTLQPVRVELDTFGIHAHGGEDRECDHAGHDSDQEAEAEK